MFVAGLVVGSTVVVAPSVALTSGPGPNGNNTYGLCNAYSRGSAQGQAQKQANGAAFVALAATATMWDANNDQNESNEPSNETTQQKVAEYCAANGSHP
ncbi:MAG TPA: hypothetical protein DCQ30_13590 [Acidimicrobiaceae bacterium]|nr:hypothetical protein [Acidimicrobiaceae bacterium]